VPRGPVTAAALIGLALLHPGARASDTQASELRILNPDPDAQLDSRRVVTVIEAHEKPEGAHVVLLLDVDLPPADSAIPYKPGFVHLNRGELWHAFEAVPHGPHRLIAVLADTARLALSPLVMDSVRFFVKPKS